MNGEPLHLKPHHHKRSDNYGSIEITEAMKMDNGTYQCFTKNKYGGAMSEKATFHVAGTNFYMIIVSFIESDTVNCLLVGHTDANYANSVHAKMAKWLLLCRN